MVWANTPSPQVNFLKELGVFFDEPLPREVAKDQVLPRTSGGIPTGARATKTERVWLTPDDVKSNLPQVQKLNEVAQGRGQSLAQLAIAWTLRKPAVTSSLIGATSVQQLENNLAALNNFSLSGAELNKIEEILKD